MYQILDESGNTAWETSEWENGATITLIDGNTTDLGTVNLEANGFSDAEFYGFGWLDEGEDLSGGATITGTVKTSSGIGVPKLESLPIRLIIFSGLIMYRPAQTDRMN